MRLSWSDERFRGIVWQVVIVAVVVGVIWWLWHNTTTNLRTRNIATGFDFLSREAGLPIGESLIAYSPADSYFRALLAGLPVAQVASRLTGRRLVAVPFSDSCPPLVRDPAAAPVLAPKRPIGSGAVGCCEATAAIAATTSALATAFPLSVDRTGAGTVALANG